MSQTQPQIKKLLDGEQIQKRVQELAMQISNDYRDKTPVLVGILKGSIVFLGDLLKHLEIDCAVDFIAASSYREEQQPTGVVRIVMDVTMNIEDHDVLLVEDVVDTGVTLDYLRENLLTRRPRSLKICVLLDKKEARKRPVTLDYTGFEIPNHFVVGYGLDLHELYRNLPYVGYVEKNG